jgi:hypothetical protein
MKLTLAMSALVASLAVGAVSAIRGQDKVEPKENKVVRPAMPVLQPLRPTANWVGTIPDPKLKAAAPEADHVVSDATTWAQLWLTWRGTEKLPEVNFKEEVLFVFTALGPNIPALRLYVTGSSVSGTVYRTLKGGPGFGYRIIKVPRQGLKTFFGQPLNPPTPPAPAAQ